MTTSTPDAAGHHDVQRSKSGLSLQTADDDTPTYHHNDQAAAGEHDNTPSPSSHSHPASSTSGSSSSNMTPSSFWSELSPLDQTQRAGQAKAFTFEQKHQAQHHDSILSADLPPTSSSSSSEARHLPQSSSSASKLDRLQMQMPPPVFPQTRPPSSRTSTSFTQSAISSNDHPALDQSNAMQTQSTQTPQLKIDIKLANGDEDQHSSTAAKVAAGTAQHAAADVAPITPLMMDASTSTMPTNGMPPFSPNMHHFLNQSAASFNSIKTPHLPSPSTFSFISPFSTPSTHRHGSRTLFPHNHTTSPLLTSRFGSNGSGMVATTPTGFHTRQLSNESSGHSTATAAYSNSKQDASQQTDLLRSSLTSPLPYTTNQLLQGHNFPNNSSTANGDNGATIATQTPLLNVNVGMTHPSYLPSPSMLSPLRQQQTPHAITLQSLAGTGFPFNFSPAARTNLHPAVAHLVNGAHGNSIYSPQPVASVSMFSPMSTMAPSPSSGGSGSSATAAAASFSASGGVGVTNNNAKSSIFNFQTIPMRDLNSAADAVKLEQSNEDLSEMSDAALEAAKAVAQVKSDIAKQEAARIESESNDDDSPLNNHINESQPHVGSLLPTVLASLSNSPPSYNQPKLDVPTTNSSNNNTNNNNSTPITVNASNRPARRASVTAHQKIQAANAINGRSENAFNQLVAAGNNHHNHGSAVDRFSGPQASGSNQHKPCRCKKSRCLKLYCECFARRASCGPQCQCCDCHNLPQFEDERERAITSLLERDSSAFFREKEALQAAITGVHIKGCHCKKSGCMKKYCECYQAGIPCGQHCKCSACANGTEHYRTIQTEDGTVRERIKKGGNKATPQTTPAHKPPIGPPATQPTPVLTPNTLASFTLVNSLSNKPSRSPATTPSSASQYNTRHSSQQPKQQQPSLSPTPPPSTRQANNHSKASSHVHSPTAPSPSGSNVSGGESAALYDPNSGGGQAHGTAPRIKLLNHKRSLQDPVQSSDRETRSKKLATS